MRSVIPHAALEQRRCERDEAQRQAVERELTEIEVESAEVEHLLQMLVAADITAATPAELNGLVDALGAIRARAERLPERLERLRTATTTGRGI